MSLQEFLSSLSLPGTGTRKLEHLLKMTNATIDAIELVEKDMHVVEVHTRKLIE